MKRLLAVLVLLTGALWAQPAMVQSKVVAMTSYATSYSYAFGSNVTAGDWIISCSSGPTSQITSVTQSAGTATIGTFTLWESYTDSGFSVQLSCYQAAVTGTGSATIKQTYSGGSHEFSNAFFDISGVNTLGASGVTSRVSTAPYTVTTSGSTPSANVLNLAIIWLGSPTTAGSGYTLVSAATAAMSAEYQTSSSASGTQSASWGSTGLGSTNTTLFTLVNILTAANPTFSPSAGNVTSYPQTVTITSSTSGATICYTTDGSTPAASTAGTCSHGTSISNGGTASISATANLKAIATESGYVNSGVTSGTYYLLPTISLAGGIYTSTQTATIGCPYSLCYYTVDGSTPTTGSSSVANGGTVSIAHTELLTVEAIGGSSNTQATAEYVLPNETALVTDNFQSYYNTNLLPGITQNQLPLDVWATNSAYKSLTGANSAWLYTQLDSVQGGTNVQLVTASGSSVIATRTNEGYPNNHGAGIYVHPTTSGAGVGVGCTTSNCVVLQYLSGTPNGALYLLDVITSTSYAVLLANYSDPVSLQLYRIGCHVYALVNGATPSTWSTYYTVSGCTGGAPALYESASGAKMYNLSAYATAASSGYTPPTIPSPPFTDAMNTSGWTDTAPPWLRAGSGSFGATFGAQSDGSGGYAVGPNGVSGQAKAGMRMYEGKFNINQYATGTVDVNANDLNINNYFLGVLMQQIVPGNTANVGNISNAAGAAGFDAVAAYCGLEPGTKGVPATVCATKTEYCGTPYLHCTEVDPTNSPLNQVNTISGSLTTLMRGDKYRVSMTNNYVDVYCQQSSSPPGAWTSSMTMTAGTTAIETNGMIWIASTSGTAGSTKPTFPPGASWSTTTYTGTTVSDGTGAWMYWGDACSTGSPHWTRVMHAYFPYLSNASSTTGLNQALGIGRPFIWGGGNNSPMFQKVTVGNVGDSGDPCSTAGACLTPTTWIPQSFIP